MAVATAAAALLASGAGVASAAPAAAEAASHPAAAPPPRHVYPTKVAKLRVRTLPSTDSKVVKVLGAAGTKVTVDCYARGQAIGGDSIWYHIVAPAKGFVAAYYVKSGHDPARGVLACTAYYLQS
jgi:hypothetical protein